MFLAYLSGATTDGVPTARGIFVGNGMSFTKVAVQGEQLPSLGILSGLSAHVSNDVGGVAYFVAQID